MADNGCLELLIKLVSTPHFVEGRDEVSVSETILKLQQKFVLWTMVMCCEGSRRAREGSCYCYLLQA